MTTEYCEGIAERLLRKMKSPVGRYFRWKLSNEGEEVFMKVISSFDKDYFSVNPTFFAPQLTYFEDIDRSIVSGTKVTTDQLERYYQEVRPNELPDNVRRIFSRTRDEQSFRGAVRSQKSDIRNILRTA